MCVRPGRLEDGTGVDQGRGEDMVDECFETEVDRVGTVEAFLFVLCECEVVCLLMLRG